MYFRVSGHNNALHAFQVFSMAHWEMVPIVSATASGVEAGMGPERLYAGVGADDYR